MKKILLFGFVMYGAVCVFGQATQQAANSQRPKLPIEYFAEYNLYKDEMGKSHQNDKSSHYCYEEALQVCPKGWHLPSQSEWAGIFSYDRKLGKKEAEPVTINGVTKNYFSEYMKSSDNPQIRYGIRFKRDPDMELDNRLLSAYRYEFFGVAPLNSALKVTVRYLGETFKGTISNIANEEYWAQNNKGDIVRIFPLAGYHINMSMSIGDVGGMGMYWTSSTSIETCCGYCPRMVWIWEKIEPKITVRCDDGSFSATDKERQSVYSVRCIKDND